MADLFICAIITGEPEDLDCSLYHHRPSFICKKDCINTTDKKMWSYILVLFINLLIHWMKMIWKLSTAEYYYIGVNQFIFCINGVKSIVIKVKVKGSLILLRFIPQTAIQKSVLFYGLKWANIGNTDTQRYIEMHCTLWPSYLYIGISCSIKCVPSNPLALTYILLMPYGSVVADMWR